MTEILEFYRMLMPLGVLIGMMIILLLWWLCENAIKESRREKRAILTLFKNKDDATMMSNFWRLNE